MPCVGVSAGLAQSGGALLKGKDIWRVVSRWHTARRWVVVGFWLVCSVTGVLAQDGRWECMTVAGVQAFEQRDYAEAVRQFQAALPLADAGSLAPSLMNLAAVYYAQGHYTDATPLYQRALVLQEQVLGPDHPQLVSVLEAKAALHRKMHPVRSLLPWSPASQMAVRARRIREREERAVLQVFLWGPRDARQLLEMARPGSDGRGPIPTCSRPRTTLWSPIRPTLHDPTGQPGQAFAADLQQRSGIFAGINQVRGVQSVYGYGHLVAVFTGFSQVRAEEDKQC